MAKKPGSGNNYRRGRAKEYRIRNKLLKAGWPIVLRMAGSHGFCDLLAIWPEKKIIWAIQIKNYKLAPGERMKILNDTLNINGKYDCSVVVWDKDFIDDSIS